MIEVAEELEYMADESEQTGKPVDCFALSDRRYDGYLPRGDVNFSGTAGELRHFAARIREDANS
jgi:hypothetical protein